MSLSLVYCTILVVPPMSQCLPFITYQTMPSNGWYFHHNRHGTVNGRSMVQCMVEARYIVRWKHGTVYGKVVVQSMVVPSVKLGAILTSNLACMYGSCPEPCMKELLPSVHELSWLHPAIPPCSPLLTLTLSPCRIGSLKVLNDRLSQRRWLSCASDPFTKVSHSPLLYLPFPEYLQC